MDWNNNQYGNDQYGNDQYGNTQYGNNQYGYDQNNTYGNNTYSGFNPYSEQNDFSTQATARDYWEAKNRIPAQCPGKEITALVFGIFSVVLGGLSMLFCWNIYVTVVYLVCVISYAVVVFVLNSKINLQAEITTKKIKIARVLAIVGAALCLVAFIASVFITAIIGTKIRTSTPTYSTPNNYTYYSF